MIKDFVIAGTLAPRHRDAGLTLVENDHIIELRSNQEKEPVARFSATGVTIEEIYKEADKHLEKLAVQRWNHNKADPVST